MATEHAALTRAFGAALAGLALGACALPNPYAATAPAAQAVPAAPGTTASAPTAAAQAPPPAVPGASAAPAQPAREYRLGAAAQSLVTQARAQVARGELPGASTTLDRALRIEPSNPLLWIELARLRLAENDPHQAEGCARKALSLASADRATHAQAGRVLADVLRAEHRNQEARALESEPWMN